LSSKPRIPRRYLPRKDQFEVIRRSARHPLWWLPDPVANQDEAYRRIWQNLRSIAEVRDGRHDDEAWRSHVGHFALCCVRVPPDAFSPEYGRLLEALSQFSFARIHPDSFLHIPIQEIGYVVDDPVTRNEISRNQLDEFITVSQRPLIDFPRFRIGVGPVNSFADAAFLDVEDDGWLSRIHRRLVDLSSVPPSMKYPYLPHVTIAHYDRVAPIENLPAVLAEWRDVPLGEFVAEDVQVVLLDTQNAEAEFEIAHSYKLGTTRATGGIPVRSDPVFD
jgi:2'-5' RNA ligase